MHKSRTRFIKAILVISLASILAACSPSVAKKVTTEPPRPKILIGSSTKSDVEALFGQPTDVLFRDGEVWVYSGLKPEDVAGLMPFYCGDKPLVFYFSLDGTVSRIGRRVPAIPSLHQE